MQMEISLETKIKQRLEDDLWWIEYVSGPFTIFRVPANVRERSKDLYEPRMVSIGPYYYQLRNGRLKAMEDQKWRLLRSFLGRNSDISVEGYIKVIRGLENSARQCYGEGFNIKKDDFIQMLLLDGCFILELFFKWRSEDRDTLFKEGWGPTTIFADMLLFENQIPFFVVEKLYDLVLTGEATNNRDVFLSHFAKFLMDEDQPTHTTHVIWPEKIIHMLDLYHHFLVSSHRNKEGTNRQNSSSVWKRRLVNWITPNPNKQGARRSLRQIPCATELSEAGVMFTKKLSPNNLFDVKFERGILQIPPLNIDSNQKALLTNLIALEKHKTWGGQTVTSYVALMDSLINTKEDVALLQHAGVIHNMLSSHQEAAVFFNRLGDGTSFDYVNHHFAKLFKHVQQYYDSNWNRSCARLIHDYFNSPWAVLSVVAAMILLGLSGLQTFYTVYPYYRPHN